MRINNFNFLNQYPLKFLAGSIAILSTLVTRVATQALNSTSVVQEKQPSVIGSNVERLIIGGSIFSIGILLILCALKKANDYYNNNDQVMVMSFKNTGSQRNSLDLESQGRANPACRKSVLIMDPRGYTYHTHSGSFIRNEGNVPGSAPVELEPITEK